MSGEEMREAQADGESVNKSSGTSLTVDFSEEMSGHSEADPERGASSLSDFSRRMSAAAANGAASGEEAGASGMANTYGHTMSALRLMEDEAFLLRRALEPPPPIFHLRAEQLQHKNVALELQARADLLAMGRAEPKPQSPFLRPDKAGGEDDGTGRRQAPIHTKVFTCNAGTAEEMIASFAKILIDDKVFSVQLQDKNEEGDTTRSIGPDEDSAYRAAMRSACQDAIIIEKGKRRKRQTIWRCDILTSRGFVVLGSDGSATNKGVRLVPNTHSRSAMLAKLRKSVKWNVSGHSIDFVCLVIVAPSPGSPNMAPTIGPVATAHTFASMLSDEPFYLAVQKHLSDPALREEVLTFITSKMMVRQANTEKKHAKVTSSVSFTETETERRKRKAKESTLIFSRRFVGIYNDVMRLRKNYGSQWTESIHPFDKDDALKVVSAMFWELFSTIAPAISIGMVYSEKTKGAIGVSEILISEACCGIIYAIFGSLPCGVFRSTGPLMSYVSILAKWSADAFDAELMPFYKWTAIWTGIFLALYGMTEASVLIKYCGRFTEECLAFFVSLVFIVSAMETMAFQIEEYYDLSFVCLFIGTFILSNWFRRANQSRLTLNFVRTLIADIAPAISIILMSCLSYAVPGKSSEVLRVNVSMNSSQPFTTSSGRSWYIGDAGMTLGDIGLCIIPGLLLSLLFMIEANVGVLLTCSPSAKLESGAPYLHWDTFLSGLLCIVCGFFGLPLCMISLPHSPMKVQVLADTEEDDDGDEVILRSRETRWPGLVSHVIMLVIVGWASDWIEMIPQGVPFGYLLYAGVESLSDNDLFGRMLLLVTDPSMYPPNHYVRFLKFSTIVLYTFVQCLAFLLLWLVHDNFYAEALNELQFSIAMLFPLVLVLMVPLRLFILPLFFTKLDLELLTEVDDSLVAKLVY